jgi:hypothetical protein
MVLELIGDFLVNHPLDSVVSLPLDLRGDRAHDKVEVRGSNPCTGLGLSTLTYVAEGGVLV